MSDANGESNTAIVMLAGPIKHWWDENWDTVEHWDYVSWRDAVNDGLVDEGYLVYRPHEAFKGRWDERAQSVNDLVLRTSDVILNLTPPRVPSLGTDGEILYAKNHANALIVPAPPVEDVDKGISNLMLRLQRLNIHHHLVAQEVVLESVATRPGQEWKVQAAVNHFVGHVLRTHYFNEEGHVQATDAAKVRVHSSRRHALVTPIEGQSLRVPKPDLLKVEVLERNLMAL
jgi:hypothetical protein